MTAFKQKSKCLQCGVTIRGRTATELAHNAKAHNYKKHPWVYALNQNYKVILGTGENRASIRHWLFRMKNRVNGQHVNGRRNYRRLIERLSLLKERTKLVLRNQTN